MTSNKKDPVLVVLQLSGGNDYLNTVIPYTDPLYWDARPGVKIPESDIIDLDGKFGFHPSMQVIKDIYDQGNAAIIHGVGYANSIRSHFRSMDIWHTCEPDKVGTEGWLGKVLADLDPTKENVLTGVNFGRGLPRALAKEGVPVASVGNLETYQLPSGEGVRVDNGFREGMDIPIYYDPMLSKLITYGKTREEAIELMLEAIQNYKIKGVQTTLPFGSFVFAHEAFRSGNFDTHFVKTHYSPEKIKEQTAAEAEVAAMIALYQYLEDKKIVRLPSN